MASSSQTQLVRSHDIFHGLPTFPDTPEYKNLTAIVTGASGISGQHMIRVLAQAPERWTKIYSMSRRPPPDYLLKKLGKQAEIVEHIALDFFAGPEEMGKKMKEAGVKADHVFYFAYTEPKAGAGQLRWSNAQDMADQNTEMLVNFLGACDVADIKPRRVMLQTGAKQYGGHLGPPKIPQFEGDPRVTGTPNFYYAQEDALFKWCEGRSTSWNVARPSFIVGAVGDNLLNHLYGLAIYAAVQAHLKQPLHFPSTLESWDSISCQSSAFIDAYQEEWAVLNPKAEAQDFNVQDDSLFSWGRFWPEVAKWFGTDYTKPVLEKEKFKHNPVGRTPPRGFGESASFSSSFTLVEWASKPEVQSAWTELAKNHNIKSNPFDDPHKSFSLTDAAIQWAWGIQLADNKARKMGWHGFVDSFESAFHTFREFAEFGITPPMAVKEWEAPY